MRTGPALLSDRSIIPLLLMCNVVHRVVVLYRFSSAYVSTDDAVMWGAAVDMGYGDFHSPYYYGQNYGPMLEAFIAAPFTRTGIPMAWLMPSISALFTLLPFVSFALWHARHRRTLAGAAFAALPLLLPNEFCLMTSMPRGFVTGSPLLAALPWLLDARGLRSRSFLIGVVISLAWFANPNSIVFTAGFAAWYLVSGPPFFQNAWPLGLGLVPGLAAHLFAQAWCRDHPDRIIQAMGPDQLTFDLRYLFQGLSSLDDHFRWLMPIVHPYGSLLGLSLIAVLLLLIARRSWPGSVGLSAVILVTALALGFGKTHQGWDWIFYPLSRMFLCLPLALAWGISMLLRRSAPSRAVVRGLVAVPLAYLCWNMVTLRGTCEAQLAQPQVWVGVASVEDLRSDAAVLQAISTRSGAKAVIPLVVPSQIWPQFRAYLYPVLRPDAPVTYLGVDERRYWIRATCARTVYPDILFTGGDPEKWQALRAADHRFLPVGRSFGDELNVLTANTIPTDSLIRIMLEAVGPSE